MTRRKFFKHLTRAHRYLGLILGVQILIWFTSGFVMSFFDIDQVRGKHIAQRVSADVDMAGVLPLENLPIAEFKTAQLMSAVDAPIYKITGDDTQYFDARLGTLWTGITAGAASDAAKLYYKGDAPEPIITKLETAPIEYRDALPVWQVSYDDRSKTRLYLDANTGELRAVRTRLWRVFDFMWMLHIMDYDTRDDINNWWLWLCSAAAALFAISGLMLVVHRMFLRPRASS